MHIHGLFGNGPLSFPSSAAEMFTFFFFLLLRSRTSNGRCWANCTDCVFPLKSTELLFFFFFLPPSRLTSLSGWSAFSVSVLYEKMAVECLLLLVLLLCVLPLFCSWSCNYPDLRSAEKRDNDFNLFSSQPCEQSFYKVLHSY